MLTNYNLVADSADAQKYLKGYHSSTGVATACLRATETHNMCLESMLEEDLKTILTKNQLKIVNYKLQGFKNIEIARIFGLCPASITKRLAKIKKVIREYLTK